MEVAPNAESNLIMTVLPIVFILLIAAVVFIVILVIVKNASPKSTANDAVLLDLKNQLNELKTKQIQSQAEALKEQQRLLLDSQRELR